MGETPTNTQAASEPIDDTIQGGRESTSQVHGTSQQREPAAAQQREQAVPQQREPAGAQQEQQALSQQTATGGRDSSSQVQQAHHTQISQHCSCLCCHNQPSRQQKKAHQAQTKAYKEGSVGNRKRSREEANLPDDPKTSNSLEERRKELDWMLQTYHTSVAREVHARELAEEAISSNPFALAATLADEDTMYLHQARKQPDWEEFKRAMQKEIKDHTDNEHWIVIPRSEVPRGQKIMRGVWSMKRKRRVSTGEIYKWKGRLCIDGSSQEQGINYWETFSPVVTWETVRSLLTLAIMNGWETRQIDFVLAFPQAEVECPMYMEATQGCNVNVS